MKQKPLIPYFEGRNRSFYKYPMSVYPILILSQDFEKYEFENEGYKPQYFENERDQWILGILLDRDSIFFESIVNDFLCESYDNLLRSLIYKHGIFNHQIFLKNIREQVVEKYTEANIDVDRFRNLLNELPQRSKWENKPQGYFIKEERDVIYVILECVYEQTLLRIMPELGDDNSDNSQGTYNKLQYWFKEYAIQRDCNLCGRKYRVIDIPCNYYFGSNGCIDCCFSCPITLEPTKKQLFSLIPDFIDICGFIPNSNIGPIKYSFTSRLSDEKKIDVFQAYAKMGGIDYVKTKFGSWFKALAEVGVLPDDVLPTARGVRCLAQDGHVCHSLAEQLIDNWLSDHQIPHEREPSYPVHAKFNN